MQEAIVFLLRVQCRRKESSRSLSHLLMSFLLITPASMDWTQVDETWWGYGRHRPKATYMTRLQTKIQILRRFVFRNRN